MRNNFRLSAVAVAGILILGACGGEEDPIVAPAAQEASTTTVVTTAPTTTVVATTTPTTVAVTTTAAPAPTVAKVPANSASRAEMTAAFTAAGISNASRWAIEVEEYRPYPTNDPTFAKLRQNLAKYNPGPGVVDAIISTLSL